jgi:tetratricopeptide (TPR) repeat protein
MKTMLRHLGAAVLIAAALPAPGAESTFPVLPGLGTHTRIVTTRSPEAQRYFDQGLNLYFGFNHGAAIRSFQEAARLDPSCAMTHWGIALACGPHINFPMVPPPMAEQAWSELGLARKNVAAATPVERDLIAALAARYANPQPDDRGPLDRAYADAMRGVWHKYSSDADVGVLFAEAMMDLRPWDQWTPAGQPEPGTDEIIATLDAVLKLDVQHPFANHLYVHALEASPHPERAMAAADRLRDLQPGLAHIVHMPSHIDIRVGHWQQAITANEKAIRAAQQIHSMAGPPRGMIVFYNAHNQQMLAWAAMMTGQRVLALVHVRTMVAEIPTDTLKEFAMVTEGMMAMPLEVLVRFGQWDEILGAPDFADWMPLARTLRLGVRGIALAAKGDPAGARAEQAAYLEAAKKVPADEMFLNNTAAAVIAIMTPMLEGEILVRERKVKAGIARLRAAVQAEDALHYDEPPGWILPVRHSLGATLMTTGQFAEAEQVYREDLARLPDNGWSLFGLARSLRLQNKNEMEAAQLEAKFQTIWAHADLQLTSSCLCQPGA